MNRSFHPLKPGSILFYLRKKISCVCNSRKRRPCISWCGLLALLLITFPITASAQIIPGAERLAEYLPLLQGKRVALLINQTSRVGRTNLADTLRKRGVNLIRIFVPEHGFRGTSDAGADVANGKDGMTGLPIISLYGEQKKPKAAQMADFDILIYDLQDVGVRFYTYISTLQYAMEACAENGRQLIILDRPDPNGSYVDGPVLEKEFKSFVGMQPVPVVYGMTPGEYAKMLTGEQWYDGAAKLSLKVIPCREYDHSMAYEPPVSPSPNLRTWHSIIAYPSLCFFEGTAISVGRGTDAPFEQCGHPALAAAFTYSFTPRPSAGAAKPLYNGEKCFGISLKTIDFSPQIDLLFLTSIYKAFSEKSKFFNSFFEKLAGTAKLRDQIEAGMSADAIRASWQPGVKAFKKIRRKYLLYKDFE